MAYYNNIQIPMILGMPSIQSNSNMISNNASCNLGNDSSIDVGYSNYLNGLGLNFSAPSDPSQNVAAGSDNCSHPSLISIRRDSGFAHSSLDELSIGIMSSNPDREESKGGAASGQREHNFNTLNNSNPSFLLSSSSSTTPTGSTPVVPSMSNQGMDYILHNVQSMYLAQHQHQQQHNRHQNHQLQQCPVASTSSSSSHCSAYSTIGSCQSPPRATDSWNITSAPSHATVFSSNTNAPTSQNSYANNSIIGPAYNMQQQQQQQFPMGMIPSQPAQQQTSNQQALMSPLQYHPRQGQLQHPRERKPEMQITTNFEMGQQTPSGFSPTVHWEPSSYDLAKFSSAPAASPSMSAANNIVQAGQQSYPWGFVSSPVESSFSSESSTPFAYDTYLSERRPRRIDSDGSSSLIIRSRKSSTSSTSSMGSQRRASNLRESCSNGIPTGSSSPRIGQATSTSSPTHKCPKCGQCFAGPAVLVRHIESIHDKLLWNCVGCKSNLSRRDAVTRHINLSPMDSVCRAVGTIGQVKTSNGVEVHYEVSPYRAKPLDEVMSRMGKKISSALRKEIDRTKAEMQMREATAAAGAATVPFTANPAFMNGISDGNTMMSANANNCQMTSIGDDMEMYSEGEDEFAEDGSFKRRRRYLIADTDALGQKRK
ncbi:hypothetical protein BGZ58_010782 [Dissophora ornata]|nr:hypothetical protein BGZ58_010782 [Dissophora ornata]